MSPTACGALFSARTTQQPSQNLVELWWNPRGTLPQGRSGPPRSLSGLRPQSFQLLGNNWAKLGHPAKSVLVAGVCLLQRKMGYIQKGRIKGESKAMQRRPCGISARGCLSTNHFSIPSLNVQNKDVFHAENQAGCFYQPGCFKMLSQHRTPHGFHGFLLAST